METAKVDIRKLQLLNDRINQVIDALHQVRLSVHALQQGYQTQQQPYGAGFGTQAFGPFQGQTFNPLLQQSPFQQNPFQQTQQNPFQQSFGQGMMNPMGTGTTPSLLHTGTPWLGQGLSHTSSEQDLFNYNRPLWSDPLLAARLSSTFPYAHYPVPPVVTLF